LKTIQSGHLLTQKIGLFEVELCSGFFCRAGCTRNWVNSKTRWFWLEVLVKGGVASHGEGPVQESELKKMDGNMVTLRWHPSSE